MHLHGYGLASDNWRRLLGARMRSAISGGQGECHTTNHVLLLLLLSLLRIYTMDGGMHGRVVGLHLLRRLLVL